MPVVTEPLLGTYGSCGDSHPSVVSLRKDVKYLSNQNLLLLLSLLALLSVEIYVLYWYQWSNPEPDSLVFGSREPLTFPVLIVDEFVTEDMLMKPLAAGSVYRRAIK